jgi:N-acetylated-alpha-linked acidic dipeptidase
MTNRVRFAVLLSACAFGAVSTAWAAPPPTGTELEARLDAAINPAEMGTWLKLLAAEPNHVGSPHDKTNADWIAAQLKSWGWDTRIETFWVLYPTPISEALELTTGPGAPFKATLQEPPIPGDESSLRGQATALPAYVAFQGDGDVTAPLVYVNYGMPADYDALERMGISVKGKIAIARYGAGWRGLKPKLAQDHGAVGCIIYSDPRDDGYSADDVYPKGAARPPHGFQRGSVADMTLYPGDPLTPGVGATKDAKRLTREEAPTILKIPTLPISYGDAQVLLGALGGPVAPPNWRGSLPITYHVGGAGAQIHLAVKSDWSLKPVYDVVGVLNGREKPNEWVIRGNHHDGWVMGASDPLSGQIALLAEAKAMGGLVKSGWRPKRTIVYTSWDGEEPMLLGSTEWAETHAAELKAKGVIYINTDGNARGFFRAEGSHDFQHFVSQVARDVKDPETGVSVEERARARLAVSASEPGANEETKALGKVAADPSKDLLIGALGSGSDYSAYLQHLGLPAIDVGYGGEGESGGVYHSLYDDYEHHSRFVDPGFVYDATLARTVGRMVMRIADADLPVQRYGDFADTVGRYLDEVKKLADTKRDEAAAQAKLLAAGAYKLAADPAQSSAPPSPFAASPKLDFAPMDGAVAKLKASAAAFDSSLAAKGTGLSKAQRDKLDAAIRPLDQTLLREEGLPFRPWYKNMIYAPGRFTGYGAKTLPGVREAIEERRFTDATTYVALTAQALNAYAGQLDQATAIVNGK